MKNALKKIWTWMTTATEEPEMVWIWNIWQFDTVEQAVNFLNATAWDLDSETVNILSSNGKVQVVGQVWMDKAEIKKEAANEDA